MKYFRDDGDLGADIELPNIVDLRDRIITFIGLNKILTVEFAFIQCSYWEFKELWFSGHLKEEKYEEKYNMFEPHWKMMTPYGLIEIQIHVAIGD